MQTCPKTTQGLKFTKYFTAGNPHLYQLHLSENLPSEQILLSPEQSHNRGLDI